MSVTVAPYLLCNIYINSSVVNRLSQHKGFASTRLKVAAL
jgi:hypothetical protein